LVRFQFSFSASRKHERKRGGGGRGRGRGREEGGDGWSIYITAFTNLDQVLQAIYVGIFTVEQIRGSSKLYFLLAKSTLKIFALNNFGASYMDSPLTTLCE
jgi:hypothetical protein